MNKERLEKRFPVGIPFPIELGMLFDWAGENGYPISGCFELYIDEHDSISKWFGTNEVKNLFGIFGKGPDGSLYGIWKEKEGNYPIVHMGSEGQNNIILADSIKDFLRLLAIGYDEIGFADLDSSPEDRNNVNQNFQDWVITMFGVEIPRVGSEITNSTRTRSSDFQAWIETVVK